MPDQVSVQHPVGLDGIRRARVSFAVTNERFSQFSPWLIAQRADLSRGAHRIRNTAPADEGQVILVLTIGVLQSEKMSFTFRS
jgi:hypothetical protein